MRGTPYHDHDPDCIQPLRPEVGRPVRLFVRTRAASGELLYRARGELWTRPLRPAEGGLFAEAVVEEPVFRYVFFLEDRYLSAHGLEKSLPRYDRFFHLIAPGPPEWAAGRVWYQIFPDRFRNGRPELTPRPGAWTYRGRPIVVSPWDADPDPELGPRQFFGGDLWGVIEGLDHLADLGVEGVYLTPIFQSPSNHRYDVADYLRVDPHLGGEAAFDALVGALKERGMRLVLDGVYNHVGSTFWGFREALENPHSPWREAFVFRPDGGYAAFYDLPELPKVDWRSPLARDYLLGALRHWLRRGTDGWRLDCAHQMGEGDGDQENARVLDRLRRAARAEKPASYLFAELSFDAVPYLRTGALDGAMHYPGFMHPLLAWLTGRDPYGRPLRLDAAELAGVLWDQYAALPTNLRATMYTLIGSHDAPRPLWRVGGDVEKLKLLFGVLLSYPGAPGIYYGDEIGLSQPNPPDRWIGDPLNRAPFPWDRRRWNLEVLAHVRRLVALKKAHPALRRGAMRPLAAPKGVLAFRRIWSGEEVWVFAGAAPYRLVLPPGTDLWSGAALEGETEAEGLLLFRPERNGK